MKELSDRSFTFRGLRLVCEVEASLRDVNKVYMAFIKGNYILHTTTVRISEGNCLCGLTKFGVAIYATSTYQTDFLQIPSRKNTVYAKC